MALRWYSTVVDCHDPAAQARWWGAALGWNIIYEADDEVVLVPEHLADETDTALSWDQRGPGLVFARVPEQKVLKNRLHFDLAPHTSDDRAAEIERLLGLGASRVHVGQSPAVTWEVLADPEGNEFCVLSSRDS